MFKVPELYRHAVRDAPDSRAGNNGIFVIPLCNKKIVAHVIASDGLDWEHVSVTIANKQRTPRWEEMCKIKDLFWGPEDCVIQFHPPQSEYVNAHPYCLHLWRYSGKGEGNGWIPTPAKVCV